MVSDPAVSCLSFIGGKETGNAIAERMEMRGVPYMLEMEGINAYGVWEFSNWAELEKQIKKASSMASNDAPPTCDSSFSANSFLASSIPI